jgi:peptidoglycan/xylan/chitin deacetylase (PgdA/CDA1 family)
MTDLLTHGRYDYSAIRHRAAYNWPGSKRLAVYLAINVEHFAFGEGLGAELAPGGPQPDVLNYAWRDWGNRVGVWRLLDLFDSLSLPTSVLVNSSIYTHCPVVMDAFRARGDEVVAHGRTNAERQGVLDRDAETRLIAETTQAITAAEGHPPRGWLGPWISESHATPDLLAEAGYAYLLDWCMDDQPVWMRAGEGRILSVPYPQELNDIPAIVVRKDSPAAFADSIVDAFDEMTDQSQAAPLVMGIALHPYIIAHPHRLRPLRRALQHIAQHSETVWITTSGAIAAHAAALPMGLVPGDA